MARRSGSLISAGLEFLPPRALPGGVLLRNTIITRANAMAAASRTLPARTRYTTPEMATTATAWPSAEAGEWPCPSRAEPYHAFCPSKGGLGRIVTGSGDRFDRRCASRKTRPPIGLVHPMRTAQANLGKKWAVSAVARRSRQKTSKTTTSRTPSKIAISTTDAESPSMSRTLHRPQSTGSWQYCWPLVLVAIQRPTHYEWVPVCCSPG